MIQCKRIVLAALFGLLVLLGTTAMAAETFPNITMTGKLTDAQKAYVGNDGVGFTLADIKADYLLVNAFSMYCPICQRDAPHLNKVYETVNAADTEGRVKFLGLGLGNTAFEVAFFQKKYNVEYPIVWDDDYAIHKALGEVGTPTYYLVKLTGGSYEILHQSEGEIEDIEGFAQMILNKSGVR